MAESLSEQESEVVKVLDKIKREMMQRRQLSAQNKTNKVLSQVNTNLQKLQSQPKTAESKEKAQVIKFPSVSEIVGGFARMSPIFTREYSSWMKDTVDIANDGNVELEKINNSLQRLSSANEKTGDNDSVEYLDLISDQLKASNDDNIKRLDKQTDSFGSMSAELTRIGDVVTDIRDGEISSIAKDGRNSLVRLNSIENKIGQVGGRIVGVLTRILEGDQAERENNEFRRAEEGKEVGGNPRASSVIPKDDDEKDSGGSGVAAAVAALLGLSGLKAFMMMPFKGIGKVVGSFFGMFSKFGATIAGLLGPFGKVLKVLKVGPIALISAIWDFGKGFINAKEILGQAKVSIVDRLRAGIGELLGGFGDLADWLAKIVGFDTDFGKGVRDIWMKITELPTKWANSVLDWFSNDLFAGIGRGTALTEIPGKIADNLQSELIKLVDWITSGFSDFVDEGISVASKIVDDIKKGFAENVKKPFFNMLNSITGAMFDIVDKFVEIIPDALGGAAAKRKMSEARQSMMIGMEEQQAPGDNPVAQQQVAPQSPNTSALSALPPAPVVTDPQDRNSMLKGAYAGIGGGSMGKAKPDAGRTVSNIEKVKSVYSDVPASVVMPVQQNVNNAKQVTTNNNFNSTSLEPSNQTDNGRILWDW